MCYSIDCKGMSKEKSSTPTGRSEFRFSYKNATHTEVKKDSAPWSWILYIFVVVA